MFYGFRTYTLGTIAGAVIVGGLVGVLRLPPAIADELDTTLAEILPPAGTSIDPDSLVKFDDRDYAVTYEDWVDTNALSRVTVRKIAFGRQSVVTVTSTDSATFSSEAMFSPNIRYPGVHVRAVPGGAQSPIAAYLSPNGWVTTALLDAGSFLYIAPTDLGGGALITDDRVCTFGDTFARC